MEFKLLINGTLVDGAMQMDVLNPATEEVLAVCPRASQEQMGEAIAAAKAAFPSWSSTSVAERGKLIHRMADSLEERKDEFARLLTQEQGKPLAQAEGEISIATVFFRHFANVALDDKVIEDSSRRRIVKRRKPLGVVGAILPWNFPMAILSFKLPVALITGNTVILKPAPTTPLTALLLGEICAEIFPHGVVNVVTDANDLGQYLSSHPDVAKISFTGSTETGRKVMESSAPSLKRLTLELGGNDAAVVRADADPATAAQAIFNAAFTNAGQICLAVKRAYVHESIYDEMCDRLVTLSNAMIVDDGLMQGAGMGPLQNRAQYEKVLDLIEDARRHGRIVAGGQALARSGYFISPTIVRDISDGTRLVDEEQFGPVLPIIRYRDDNEVVERINASPWGLGGSVWSRDREKARALAEKMDSGTVWINNHMDLDPSIPFGGAKQSGIGVEFGEEGLEEFTQLQIVNEAL